MVAEIIGLYLFVAITSAIIAAVLRGTVESDVFIANLMLGGASAWSAAVLFGAVGPLLWGIPVVACFALALPVVFAYNAIMAAPGETSATAADVFQFPAEPEDLAARVG